MSPNFKQFKLVSGEEIVADVIDTEDDVLVIRAAMRIVELENMQEGYSYFSLRPFVAFQENLDSLQILSIGSITLETTPSNSILKHYANAITKMNKFLKHGKTLEDLESMSDNEIHAYMSQLLDEYSEESFEEDPEEDHVGENVVKFKPKDTVH